MKNIISGIIFIYFLTYSVYGKENVPVPGSQKTAETEGITEINSGCVPATASIDLNINNVRAKIQNGGDMWWDLIATAKYEVPKVTQTGQPRICSIFAGALWIGGYDDGGNLREAAMTYRQNGSDFYPGPLDVNSASIDPVECTKWDKIFQVTRQEINNLIQKGTISDDILHWPVSGDAGEDNHLAPYVDVNGDGRYDPVNSRDYPDVPGDQNLWFVFNDMGNTHNETKCPWSIGLEVQTTAFEYATNDEINNMTFYNHKIINRSKNKLNKVYFGQWVDPDLGYPYDDFVGCDSTRNLGICYNGEDVDPGVTGYGANPPSVGVVFLRGPQKDNGQGYLLMSKFVYYNNDLYNPNSNPTAPTDYYYYLEGFWRNGQRMRYGGDGVNNVWQDIPANFMFPDDPRKPRPAWSERSAGNTPGDRRFLQSSGTFTLKPGAVNYVTTGVVWARASSGGATGSYDLLLLASDAAQTLYNNNFKLINGPDAPDLAIEELDQELVLSLNNTAPIEKYKDSTKNASGAYTRYTFQGYLIYQLSASNVSASQVSNTDLARLVERVDIVDGVNQLVNKIYTPGLGYVPVQEVDASGDKGIKHTFDITTDAFATGADTRLKNYSQYYYLVLSYSNANDPTVNVQFLAGRNNIQVYTAIPHKTNIEFNGTQLNSKYGGGPTETTIEGTGNGGQILELTDDAITRILSVTNSNYQTAALNYKAGFGPVNVYVYDPIKVPNASFEIRLVDTNLKKLTIKSGYPGNDTSLANNTYWILTKKTSPFETDTIRTYAIQNDQLFPEWGIGVNIHKVIGPTSNYALPNDGLLESTISYTDITKPWLGSVPYSDAPSSYISNKYPWPYHWIRSGKYNTKTGTLDMALDDAWKPGKNGDLFFDPDKVYTALAGGIIAPYALCARSCQEISNSQRTFGPIFNDLTYNDNTLNGYNYQQFENIQSIDLVFTSDKTKWSQCVVIETGEDPKLSQGGAPKFNLRRHNSWLSQYAINSDGTPQYDNGGSQGKSWFPGYAIDVETGERLNIIFGEDSYFNTENGADMIWNPTYDMVNPSANDGDINRYVWGGKHFIYIMGTTAYFNAPKGKKPASFWKAYDGGATYYKFFNSSASSISDSLKKFWAAGMYVMMPVTAYPFKLLSLKDGLIPTDTKVRVRVKKPYATFQTSTSPQNYNQPYYSFTTTQIAMTNSEQLGKNAMSLINIVPNPYYAFSKYETSQIDNRVRITNLPRKCDISIFTLSGSLVRKYKIDVTDQVNTTFIDWDLKNTAGIPIASGLYIIYVNAFELGNKTLKWFGIMRPLDLNTF